MESEGNYRLIDSTFKNEQRFLPARMTERLVKTVPPGRLNAKCAIGDSDPVTLELLMNDYVLHLAIT